MAPPEWYYNFSHLPYDVKIQKANSIVIKKVRPGNIGYYTCMGWSIGDTPYEFVARAVLKLLSKQKYRNVNADCR